MTTAVNTIEYVFESRYADLAAKTSLNATLTKNFASAAWDAGASSNETLTGDGWAQFVANIATTTMFGLSITDTDQNYNTIKYGIEVNGATDYRVYELGILKYTSSGPAVTGDVFCVDRTNSVVTYSRNGTVFYTSVASESGTLLIDTSIFTNGNVIQARLFSDGDEVAITWTNAVRVATVNNSESYQADKFITIPETASRQFLSVHLEVSYRDSMTSALDVAAWRIGVRLGGSGAPSDGDVTVTIPNSGDHSSNCFTRDVTAAFTSGFGTGVDQEVRACFALAMSGATTIRNIAIKLVVTYSYIVVAPYSSAQPIVVPEDGTFDTIDENNTPTTVSITAGSYTQAEIVAIIQPQLPSDVDPAWVFSFVGGFAQFIYKNSIFSVTWTTTTLRDALGFTSNAADWSYLSSGPFRADTGRRSCARTLRIPIQSQSTYLTTSHQEIGRDATESAPANQIPVLDDWLPTDATITGLWIEVIGHDGDPSTTDFDVYVKLDSDPEILLATVEQALQTSCWFRSVLDLVDYGLDRSVAHSLNMRTSLANTCSAFGAILGVTYTFAPVVGDQIVVSRVEALDTAMFPPFFANNSLGATAGEELIGHDLEIQEAGPITLLQSAIVTSWSKGTAGTSMRARCGAQTNRTYSLPFTQTSSGTHRVVHRIDQDSGVALARGANRIVVALSSGSGSNLQCHEAVLYVNYRCTIGSVGPDQQSRTTIWHKQSQDIRNSLFYITGATVTNRAPSLPSGYRLTSVGSRMITLSLASTQINVALKTLTGEHDGTASGNSGWKRRGGMPAFNLENTGTQEHSFDWTAEFNVDSNDSGKFDVNGVRDIRSHDNALTCQAHQLLVSAHWISYVVAGTVRGYPSGDGSGIAVRVYDATTTELLATTTTMVGGAFSALVFDDTHGVFCVAATSGAAITASAAGTPGVDTFDINFGDAVILSVTATPVTRWEPIVISFRESDALNGAFVILRVGSNRFEIYNPTDGWLGMFEDRSTIVTASGSTTLTILPNGGWWSDNFVVAVVSGRELSE